MKGTNSRHSNAAYAEPHEFCAIFREEMSALYSLALSLTGNARQAEQCFTAALDDCLASTSVFKDWARSWSRRAVVKSAIRMLAPVAGKQTAATADAASMTEPQRVANLARLHPFERFAFVMTVMERYSDQESAALLSSGPQEVKRARARALQALAQTGQSSAAVYAGGIHNHRTMPATA